MRRLPLFACLAALTVSCAKTSSYHNDPIPEHQTFTLNSEYVHEERTINVWTPPGYDSTTTSYPVLYMPDGGVGEDFPHIANSLKALIEADSIPPVILVGIENTKRARDLTGSSTVEKHIQYNIPMTDGSTPFRKFIVNELVPKIEADYRTTNVRGIIGESLAGLFVMETFFLEPQEFSFYIAVDPSLWWNNNALVENAHNHLSKLPTGTTTLWFTNSDATDIAPYALQLSGILDSLQPSNLHWNYDPKLEEKHHTIFRATKESALIWSLNNVVN